MVEFKIMEKVDIPFVNQIQKQAFGISTPKDFEKCITNPIYSYYVLIKQNKIIGYLGLMIIGTECELLTIALDKLYKKQGIGSLMMEFIIKYAKSKNVNSIYLEVDVNNIPAKNLYNKYGFEVSYTRKKYYGDSDALILKKSL